MFKESQNSAKSSKVYWGFQLYKKRTIEKKANMKVRFHCMITKIQSIFAILMLLAVTMLAGCSSEDDKIRELDPVLFLSFSPKNSILRTITKRKTGVISKI